MIRRAPLVPVLALAIAGSLPGQTPEKRSPSHLGSIELQLDQKWFIYPLTECQVELRGLEDVPTRMMRTAPIDNQGRVRLGLLNPGRYLLKLKERDSSLMTCQVDIAAGKPLVMQIPFDLKMNLIPCPYDGPRNPPQFIESTNALEIDYSGDPPNGYPTVEVMKSWPPSLLLMSLPRKLPFQKGQFSIHVFPDVAYDSVEVPASLGLLINDTSSSLEFSHLTIFLEAQDANGQWQPIEGPSHFVSDYRLPPVLLPAHSCRNFLVRHYKGPFKTHLRVVMKERGSDTNLLISEPFEGSIHQSQIVDAGRLRTEKWWR